MESELIQNIIVFTLAGIALFSVARNTLNSLNGSGKSGGCGGCNCKESLKRPRS